MSHVNAHRVLLKSSIMSTETWDLNFWLEHSFYFALNGTDD